MARRDPRHSAGRAERWLPVLLVLVLLASAGAAHRFELGPRWLGWGEDRAETDPAAVEPPRGLVLPSAAAPRAVAPAAPTTGDLAPRKVRRVLAEGLRDEALGPRVHALVADLDGDEPVLERGPATAIPASTMKILTSAAALEALGPGHTFQTRVVAGRRPQQIVLVGGGDPHLVGPRPTAEERDAAYPERAEIAELAALTAQSLLAAGRDRVRLGYDAGLFTGPRENERWREDYIPDGIVAPITALWVDGGRPAAGFGRVADPPLSAALAFADALADSGITVMAPPREQRVRDDAVELASVESAPLGQIVQRVLDVSDNEAAEVLLHHVGLAVSGEGSFAAGADGVVATLRRLGVSMARDEVYDGSGLSRENRLTSRTLLEVLRLAASEAHPQLREVISGLPVAGFTGSLASRFDSGDPEGRGRVRAKTGTLTGVHGLAGIARDASGTTMVLVLIADRVAVADTLAARRTLDELAAALAGCRCSR